MSSVRRPDYSTKANTWLTAAVCLLGCLAVGASALDLSAYGLGQFLSSDFLTPYFFCSDLLTGRYPLSGWTLSASPFFVPDLMFLGGLLGAFGQNGFAYGLFTPLYYLVLFALIGTCVKTVIGRVGPALLVSFLLGSIFLALRFLPGHALYLWWIGAPFCHGGIFLLGFVYLWVLSAGLRWGRIGWISLALFSLGLVGLVSDALFLFQVLLPASVALFLGRRRHPRFARWLKWQIGCVAAALAGWQIFKLLCLWQDWFYFTRILRIVPTPSHQWHAVSQFFSSLPHLLYHGWAFALLAIVAAVILVRSNSSFIDPKENSLGGVDRGLFDFYRIFCAASLLIVLPLPFLSCLWRNENNIRYLWNWLVFTGFFLALAAAVRWSHFRQRLLVVAAAVFVVCLGCGAGQLRHEPLQFPYPDDVAKLDAVLQRHGLRFGLGEYWDAKYVTVLSHAGAEVRQIRANCDLYFWDNNAFEYYERTSNGTLVWPDYQYILTNALDERATTRVFGEPVGKESAGRYQVWIYSETGQRRIREVLEPVVRQKLGPKRLRYLK
jgi:hypothetical protein